jgi:diguanylate cyclase (GGDEF)-like protein
VSAQLKTRGISWKTLLPGCLVATFLLGMALAPWRPSALDASWGTEHDNIEDLQGVPLGKVQLQGVVTFVDPMTRRFWVQDETGAIAVDQVSSAVKVGEVVRLEARKTHPYDPYLGLSSVALSDVKIAVTKHQRQLPRPLPATVRTLPEKEKNGIRVQLNAVLHQVTRSRSGLAELVLGDSGLELRAEARELKGDPNSWINAGVRVTGVSEVLRDSSGNLVGRYLWVAGANDLQLTEAAPTVSPLYSLRQLYRSQAGQDGHEIRFRGSPASALSESSWLLEDRWGAIRCQLDHPQTLPKGNTVEVRGFPIFDSQRLDLSTCRLAESSRAQATKPVDESPEPRALTTVAAIRELDEHQAQTALPVRLTGVVTYEDPDRRQLYLQDKTGGIYVKYSGARMPLFQGQKLSLIGITHAGNYAPMLVVPKLVSSGEGRLPAPITLTPRDAFSGMLDAQFVEVEGVVHPLVQAQNLKHVSFELYSSVGPVHVVGGPEFSSTGYMRSLEDASVRVRGVCGTTFNSRRQLVGFKLFVSSPSDIHVLEAPNPEPFRQPALPINQLLRFSPHERFSHRVKIAGSVTMVGNRFFYIQDQSAGVQIQGDPQGLQPGDWVEAVGYASAGGYSPILTDAVVHLLRHAVPVEAQPVTAQELVGGQFDSQLVAIDGRLLSVENSLNSKTLVVDSGGRILNAKVFVDSEQPLPPLQPESVLRLTGICTAQVSADAMYSPAGREPLGCNLAILSPEHVQVLRPAPWWNLRHTLTLLVALLLAIIVSIAWGTQLRQRVQRQNQALEKAIENTRAIQDLTLAMREITQRKQFTSKVLVHRSEEIAQLDVEFNNMLRELQLRELAKSDAETRLRQQALTDELTGLPNRRLFWDRLSHTLDVAVRENQIGALLYIDLDGFKVINDSLGHSVGDGLIAQVSDRLRARIRKSDTLARLGGDEFTIVLSRLNCKEEAGLVAKSLLEVLSPPFYVEDHEISVGASIGISLFPENATAATDLLRQADSAMYLAKQNGKNRVMYFTPRLESLVQERLSLENQLRAALARSEIALHYQPEFDLASHRLIRFEALARWQHATLGNISPSKFIPIAEESGLIVPLGTYVLQCACAEAMKWQGVLDHPIQVAVNVSSIQFTRDDFVDQVSKILRQTGLQPDLLQIELTESVMLNGIESAIDIMKRLRGLGITLAIDDFGTGYSCFGYLPKLPFNTLKVDRVFINELVTRTEMKALVQSLVTLAHNLNMQVVVEGIETSEQLEMIKALGANQVQGFLLGRPTPDPMSQLTRAPQLHDFTISATAGSGGQS